MAYAVLAAVERRVGDSGAIVGGHYLRPWEDGAIAQVSILERPPLVNRTSASGAAAGRNGRPLGWALGWPPPAPGRSVACSSRSPHRSGAVRKRAPLGLRCPFSKFPRRRSHPPRPSRTL